MGVEKIELKEGEAACIFREDGVQLIMPKLKDDEEVNDATLMCTMVAVFLKTPEAVELVQEKMTCKPEDKSN